MTYSNKLEMLTRSAALSLCLFLVVALGIGHASSANRELTVRNAWIRFMMSSVPAAAYFRLSDESGRPRVLVGADSPACGMLMLHESIVQNGMDRMIMLRSIQVPAHGHVDFTPGRYHLMCMQPSREMTPGRWVTVTLRFADGTEVVARFVVRGATGT